ncbi:AEC family transporter [bacterium]|nr:AEC family transporter [bacterium]
MQILNALVPVFAVVVLGVVLRRTGFLSEAMQREGSRLVYWVGLPCMLFHRIATAPRIDGAPDRVFLITLAGTAAAVLLSVGAAWAVRMPGRRIGTFVQASFRGNLAYVGLAVVTYAFASVGGEAAGVRAQTLAVLALAPLVPIYNIAAVVALSVSRHRFGPGAFRRIVVQVLTNPLLIACVAGAAVSLSAATLPTALAGACQLVGRLGLPLALLALGGTLAVTPVRGHVRAALGASMIKVVAVPAVGYGVAAALGASAMERGVAVILLACPTAVASYILAEQLEGDSALAASAVVLSTALCTLSLAIAVATL